jgi:hypothetical protein
LSRKGLGWTESQLDAGSSPDSGDYQGCASASRGESRARADNADLGRNVLGGRLGFALRLTLLLALDTLEDLFPMDGNALRCIDTNSHLIALHPKDGDGDIVTDHHGFTHPSRQYEHYSSSLIFGRPDLESRKNPL